MPDPAVRKRRRRVDATTLEGHLSTRLDPLSDAVLAFPLFLTYQLGLLISGAGTSGVDFITRGLALLCQRDPGTYLLLLAALLITYAGIVAWLRRSGSFHPRRFVPMLLEAGVYAVVMGSLILFVLRRFVDLLPGLNSSSELAVSGPIEIIVISAGAGLHEELWFRLILFSGLAWWFRLFAGRRTAWMAALLLSSLLFAGAHHLGPGSEPITASSFAYRSLAGVYFALIYWFRGFSVAAWTHALYDLYVLSFTS